MGYKLQNRLLGLLLMLLSLNSSYGQSPGGVAPAAWYRAGAGVYSDAGTTPATENAGVQQWNSQVGTGGFPLIQAITARKPVYSNSAVQANFNPTVTFDGSNDYMEYEAAAGNIIDRATGTIVTAGYMDQQKRSGFAGFHASMDYPGLHVYGSDYKLLFFTAGGPGYQGLSNDVFSANRYFMAGSGWTNGGGSAANYASATVSLNGNRQNHGDNKINNVQTSSASTNNFRIGGDSNWGAFSGQLNEILIYEDRLGEADLDKVETYLAIKYGSTFANGTKNYVNSGGSIVWDKEENEDYRYNIAGIARDDAGALYQKQSWSTNPGQQVLIGVFPGGGKLAQTNVANTGTLANGQYLIWGDNGGAKNPSVPIVAAGISHRFEAIWKVDGSGTVHVAWPQGFTNLSLLKGSDPTFASATPIPMTANTVEIGGVTYNYAEVTFADGDFFTFGAKLSGPGGVTAGLLMWHKADDGTTEEGPKSVWKDVSGLGRDVTQNNNAAYQPSLVTDASYTADSKEYHFNYNPFYYFDGSNDFFYRLDEYFTDDEGPGSAYGVMFNSAVSGWRTPYGWGDDDPNLVRGNDAYYVTRNNGTALSQNVSLRTTPAHIGAFSWKGWGSSANNGVYLNVDGRIYSTTSTHIGNLNSAGNFAIGSEGYNLSGTGFENYQGGISEVFAYNVDHENSTGDEKERINSYLAIKYGITLKNEDGTGVPDYLSSNSTVVWNATDNTGYNNNIAGLARDDNSALHQKMSHSNQSGQQVLIGTTGMGNINTNAENTTGLSDGQFLIWGDNGLSKALGVAHSVPSAPGGQVNLRFAAVWKVQNTGTIGNVRVTWPSGIVNLHVIQSADATIETTDTHTPMTGTTTINGVVYNYADVTLGNGTYFTFGGYIAGPGGVGEDLSLWYRADNGVETDADKKVTAWNNSTANDVKLTMSGTSAHIPYNDQTTYTKTWNFNPTLSFDGTNNYLRNTTSEYLNEDASVHYIAVARLNASASGYNSLFAISGNDDGFFLYPTGGQIYPMPAINNVFGATAAGPGSTSRYGIYSAILPKTGSPANQRGFYNGLEKIYTSPYPRTGAAYTINGTPSANNGAFIGADGTTGDNLNGDIAEVILYQEPDGGDMTNANLHKIHSYLAIKYGITLDQTTPQDYVSSGGTSVWTAANNPGYDKNIAGIARDDQGALYQKQSNSINPGSQVLISTTGLANSNAANTVGLSDQQFLVWGDNGLAKSPSEPFGTIAGEPYQRFAAIWKVQNNGVGTVRVAWRAGYANLKLVQSADETFDTSDNITDMAGTQTVNGVEYAYADVTLANGQYFTFAAFVRTPGGVAGPAVWLKANEGTSTTADGGSVDYWINYGVSGGETEPLLPANGVSKFGVNVHNFNPSVIDNTTGVHDGLLLRDVFGAPEHRALSSFVVQSQPNAGAQRTIISFGDNPVSGSSTDRPWFAGNADRLQLFWQDSYENTPVLPAGISRADNVPSVNAYYMPIWTGNPHTSTVSMNGAQATLSGNSTAGRTIGNQLYVHGDGGNNNVSEGAISEVIAYDRDLTAAERQRLNSYLAIKYGITLHTADGTERLDYLSSTSDVVWDAEVNTGYNENIAGIANDYISALHQKQSKSVNPSTNDQVTIGLGEIAATNIENPNSLSDGQFLLWGDNGETQTLAQAGETFTYAGTSTSRRMTRVWKTQNTGVNQEVLIRFPVSSVGDYDLGAGECQRLVLIVADNPEFDNATVRELTVVTDENDDPEYYDVAYTFPAEARYFTYAKVTPYTPGTVYLPDVTEISGEYGSCGAGEWAYYHKSGSDEENLLAVSGYTGGELDVMNAVIIPEGVNYDDGSRQTNLMPRISSVAVDEAATAPTSTGKVRVYYSSAELDATEVASESAGSGWYLYLGNADDVTTDIYADGLFDPSRATKVTPSATGVEDGIPYVEFDNLDELASEQIISFVYISTSEDSALPVSLISFAVTEEEGIARLRWSTANEFHNKGFEIERSEDARNWKSLGFVAAKADGESKGEYRFADEQPARGINYYRLKQIDFDGKYEYSHVASLKFSAASGLTLYPNPVTTGELNLKTLNLAIVEVSVYSLTGVEIKVPSLQENKLNVKALPAGQYILKVTEADGNVVIRHFIVN